MMSASYEFDVVIVGGGLSGQLCVQALAARAPSARVALVEQGDTLPIGHTWCCHGTDLDDPELPGTQPALMAWFLPLVDQRWRQHQVWFTDRTRVVEGDYLCVRGSSLSRRTARVLGRRGNALVLGQRVLSIADDGVMLASGLRLDGRLVLDARGLSPTAFAGKTGYQKVLGLEIEVGEDCQGFARSPVLMDTTVAQRDGFRFFYVLPFSERRFLVEETFFSDTPGLDRDEARGRVAAYLKDKGVASFAIVREEFGVLPMPWATLPAGSALSLGYRGGLFHPGTGYSLGRAALAANRIAKLVAEDPASSGSRVANALATLRASFAKSDRFCRVLNFALFRLVPGLRRRDWIFSAVYRLPTALLARFYAGRLSVRDRLSLILATARLLPDHSAQQRPLLGGNP